MIYITISKCTAGMIVRKEREKKEGKAMQALPSQLYAMASLGLHSGCPRHMPTLSDFP